MASETGGSSSTLDAGQMATGGSGGGSGAVDAALDQIASDAPAGAMGADARGDLTDAALAPDSPGTTGSCIGLFCEDFESGAIDDAVWNVKTFGGQTVAVQKDVVAHGHYAAQFHAKPNLVSYDFIITKNAPAALKGHHFGRAYFQVTPKPPSEHTEFLFAGTKGFPTLKYLELAGYHNGWQLTYINLVPAGGNSAASGPGTMEAYSSGGSLPVARWICLEWEFNDAPDQIRVFVNGTEDVAFTNIVLNNMSTGLVGGFADFGFGFYAWHPSSTPFDVYYDDIVLDTKRVNCLP